MAVPIKKQKLSKGLLEMKFMKRTKLQQEQEDFAEEGKALFEKDITEAMKNGCDKFISEPSYIYCEELIVGRLSFGGLCPHIETLMAEEETAKRGPPLHPYELDAEVSAQEMARRRDTLITTMANKYGKKKPKFLKPRDSDEEPTSD